LTFWLNIRELLVSSRRGIRDVVVSMIPQGARVLAGLVTYIALARGLGPSGLGEYALCLSVAEVTGQLSELGLGQTGTRYASRAFALGDRVGQMAVLRWAFRMRMAVVCLVSGVVFLLAPQLARYLWHDAHLTPLVRTALPVAISLALASVPITYFQSEKRFGQNAIVQVGQALFSLAAVGVLALLGAWSVRAALSVAAISTAAGAIQFLARIPREAWWPRRSDAPRARGSFWRSPVTAASADPQNDHNRLDKEKPAEFALFLFLASLIYMVTGKLDIWLIGHYLDVAQVGVYAAAGRLTLPVTILLAAFNTVLYPRAASVTTLAQTRALAIKTFKASLVLAGLGTIYSLLGPIVIPVVFGRAYRSSVHLAQLLCFAYSLSMLYHPIAQIGYNLGLVRVYWIGNVVQLLSTTLTLVILLPRVGALAGAISVLVSALIGGSLIGWLVWTRLRTGASAGPLPS
jgi:O-antigen/teichoic acid export membrane protein